MSHLVTVRPCTTRTSLSLSMSLLLSVWSAATKNMSESNLSQHGGTGTYVTSYSRSGGRSGPHTATAGARVSPDPGMQDLDPGMQILDPGRPPGRAGACVSPDSEYPGIRGYSFQDIASRIHNSFQDILEASRIYRIFQNLGTRVPPLHNRCQLLVTI